MSRVEKDFLGFRELPDKALYGIHSLRAKENFPDDTPFDPDWYKAIATVKLAYYGTYKKFSDGLAQKYPDKEIPIRILDDNVVNALANAARDVSEGEHFHAFIVPAVQGGAGTSINMNINEIIANAALIKIGNQPGDYSVIDPVEDANIYQSTNDVIPSALKIAALRLLMELEQQINLLRKETERLESRYRNSLRLAYTQMQEAVPTTWGRFFGAFNEAFSRDWWRVSKCFERIKQLNLGGGAAGTTLTVPRFIVMEVTNVLRDLTGLPIARSENLPDATSNLDSIVEIHAILKSLAVNLEKFVSDIRLHASDFGDKLLKIPARQAGSSIMPGKVNPVIPEYVISCAHIVYSGDSLIASLCGMGTLDLNAYIPVIGHTLLKDIKLLISSVNTIKAHLVNGIEIDEVKSREKVFASPSIATALLPAIGYHAATKLALEMRENGVNIYEANNKLQLIDHIKLLDLLKDEHLLEQGFMVRDIL